MGYRSALRNELNARMDVQDFLDASFCPDNQKPRNQIYSFNPPSAPGNIRISEPNSPELNTDTLSPYTLLKFPNIEPGLEKLHRERTHQLNGVKLLRHTSGHQYKGISFASNSEVICALLMEIFIPGFKLVPGVTYEVPIGKNSHGATLFADFRLGNVIIEYHPPRTSLPKTSVLCRLRKVSARLYRQQKYDDFSSPHELRVSIDKLIKLPRNKRPAFWEGVITGLSTRYAERRMKILKSNPELKDCELIVATSPLEFCEKVIKRFAPHAPSPPVLERIFKRYRNPSKRKSCPEITPSSAESALVQVNVQVQDVHSRKHRLRTSPF